MTNEKRIGNYLIEVHQDESPESPRSWDNLGTMICFHRRYDLGDKHDYNHVEYDSWSEQRKDIEKTENTCVILPLYLYDHSGITISTSPFNCNWDTSRVGWVFIDEKQLNKIKIIDSEYSIQKNITYKVYELLFAHTHAAVYSYSGLLLSQKGNGYPFDEIIKKLFEDYNVLKTYSGNKMLQELKKEIF